MRRITVYSPSHITGFFTIHDDAEDPLYRGSRGSGVNLVEGIYTRISIDRAERNRVEVRINGEPSEAEVSRWVVDWFLDRAGERYEVRVEHIIRTPIGAGFGTSGGGALTIALGLNELLGLGLDRVEAAQVAHLAEIYNRTGLGTVIAELHGGLEVRLRPGAPGIGLVRKYSVPSNHVLVALSIGGIPTRRVLSDTCLRERINMVGGRYVEEIMDKPSIESFLKLSREFAMKVGLIDEDIQGIIKGLDSHGYNASMAMVGKTIYTIIDESEVENVHRILSAAGRGRIITSRISNNGAQITT